MNKRPFQSHLQNRILLHLESSNANSLTALAKELAVHRSSVSRAAHALSDTGLILRRMKRWSLTPKGKKEVQHLHRQLPERAAKAMKTMNRLVDQTRLITPSSDMEGVSLADPLTIVLETTKFTLGATAQNSIQSLGSMIDTRIMGSMHEAVWPMINAGVRVDLLATTQSSIDSLTNMVSGAGLLTASEQNKHTLVSIVAGVDLLSSAQNVMQSVASVAAKFDSFVLPRESMQPLISAAASFTPLTSAQVAIQPLVDAAARFDSSVLVHGATQFQANSIPGVNSFITAQESLRPLLNAAMNFDSITLGPISASTQLKVAGVNQATLDSRYLHFGGVNAAPFLEASALNIMNSPQVTMALDSIRSVSLKPTIAEIAASQAFETIGSRGANIIAGLGPQLAQEALSSFSQSQQLSLAWNNQSAILGSVEASVIKQFSEANLGLDRAMRDVGAITLQSQAIANYAAPLMPGLAEVARTYKGYVVDVVSGFREGLLRDIPDIGIVIPTKITTDYIGTIKRTVLTEDQDVDDDISSRELAFLQQERVVQLDGVFNALGPNFAAMWQGSWAVLESNSPDRIRQAAHSGRELLIQVLSELAPDADFSEKEIETYGHGGKVTRRMRVKKILEGGSESTMGWADAVAKAIELTYDRLAGVSHDHSAYQRASKQQLAGLLHTLGGLLSFIDAFQYRHTHNS